MGKTMKSEENTTANDLRDLDKAATQGELEPHSRQGKNVDAWVGADKYKHFSFHDSVADAAFITAIVNAYRSGQLVHVDEVENKLTLPDCPKALWAQHFLGRSDWQVSENVTCASKGVMEAEKFVNERELRGLADEVEKLREALDRAAFVLATMPDIALRVGLQGESQWDEIAGGVDLFGALDAARAALGDSQ
jgi:hypothetical protein